MICTMLLIETVIYKICDMFAFSVVTRVVANLIFSLQRFSGKESKVVRGRTDTHSQ